MPSLEKKFVALAEQALALQSQQKILWEQLNGDKFEYRGKSKKYWGVFEYGRQGKKHLGDQSYKMLELQYF